MGQRDAPPGSYSTGSEAVAVMLAVAGGPLLALGIASAGSASALVVPDGAQVQTVRVSAEGITVDPAVLLPGPTRFRCHFVLDAAPAWAYFVAIPEGADVEAVSPTFDYASSCGPEPGSVTWGTIVDLHPGRHVWQQIDNQTEVPRTIATSPVVVVGP